MGGCTLIDIFLARAYLLIPMLYQRVKSKSISSHEKREQGLRGHPFRSSYSTPPSHLLNSQTFSQYSSCRQGSIINWRVFYSFLMRTHFAVIISIETTSLGGFHGFLPWKELSLQPLFRSPSESVCFAQRRRWLSQQGSDNVPSLVAHWWGGLLRRLGSGVSEMRSQRIGWLSWLMNSCGCCQEVSHGINNQQDICFPCFPFIATFGAPLAISFEQESHGV